MHDKYIVFVECSLISKTAKGPRPSQPAGWRHLDSLGSLVVGAGAVGRANAVGEADVVRDVTGDLDVVVGELAELAVVHAELLLLGAGAQGQARDEVEDEEDEAGEDEGPGEGSDSASELVAHLHPVVLDPAQRTPLSTIELGNPGAGRWLEEGTSI